MKGILTTLVALTLLAIGTAPAQTNVTPFLNSVTGSTNNWSWTYHTELGAPQEFSSIGAFPLATSGFTGVKSTEYQDYFTIYDFAGFIPDSNTQPPNWLFQSLNVGTTPRSIFVLDDPDIPNLTWVYDGPTITGPLELSNGLGLFTAMSIYDQQTDGTFAADATKHDPVNSNIDGLVEQTSGSVSVPAVPEPSTFVLFGAGLIGAVVMRHRARK